MAKLEKTRLVLILCRCCGNVESIEARISSFAGTGMIFLDQAEPSKFRFLDIEMVSPYNLSFMTSCNDCGTIDPQMISYQYEDIKEAEERYRIKKKMYKMYYRDRPIEYENDFFSEGDLEYRLKSKRAKSK